MKRSSLIYRLMFVYLMTSGIPASRLGVNHPRVGEPITPRMSIARVDIPVAFVPNVGQLDNTVRFRANNGQVALWQLANKTILELIDSTDQKGPTRRAVEMGWKGALPAANVRGEEELTGKYNFFTGNDPAHWRANVPTFAKVRVEGIYPGVDLVWRANGDSFEYDLHLEPGADVRQVRMRLQGVDNVREADGELLMDLPGGTLRHRRPDAYQVVDGRKLRVPVRYVIHDEKEVGFSIGSYDHRLPLVIDPAVVWSAVVVSGYTDVLQSLFETTTDMAVDTSGSVYLVG